MKSLSILRYMTDHLESMPLGVTTRMTMTNDVPILLAQLIEMKPWLHVTNGSDTKIFHGTEWIRIADEEELPKLEGKFFWFFYCPSTKMHKFSSIILMLNCTWN